MSKKGILVTITLAGLLAACSSTDGTRYAVVNTNYNNPACKISSTWCVGKHDYVPLQSKAYASDELLLVYDAKVDTLEADNIMKAYQLKPQKRVQLAALNVNLITANTNGQNPVQLRQAINANQKTVRANTNNYYYTSLVTNPAIAPVVSSTGYPFSLTGVEAAYPFTKGKGVKIGMVDTPLDLFHESLRRENIRLVDLVGAQVPAAKLLGTDIAGSLVSDNPKIGIAPEASLYVVGAFGKKADGTTGTAADIAQAIDLCIRANVDILNLSFAGDQDSLVDDMIAKAIKQGIIVVASAGNNGPSAKPAYPAALEGVIAVTAIDNKQNVLFKANRGDYIDLAAPGVGIFTTSPQSSYKLSTGTSIATAHVSGIIALLLSMKRQGFDPNILTSTAIDLGQSGKDNDYGYGLVNLSQALKALK